MMPEKWAGRMRFLNGMLAVMVAATLCVGLAEAAEFDPATSSVTDADDGISIDLAFSAPIPYRAFLLDDPARLVVDLSGVDFGSMRAGDLDRSDGVLSLGWGPIRTGWSRLVAELDGPYRMTSVEERVNDSANIVIRLEPISPEEFASLMTKGSEDNDLWALSQPVEEPKPKRRQTGAEPLIVVLDPGHGGIDPGAEAGGVTEAEVMLEFSRELAVLLNNSGMTAVMTRDHNDFVPLETRVSLARAIGADVFLSLHADTLAEGLAKGATVYVLSQSASDSAAAHLAERHDRADLLAGVDLTGQGDLVAEVMMDMARVETQPRSERLARALEASIKGAGLKMHRRPIQRAGFTVLKAPDIPSVLLEIGFLSSTTDRARLADPVWRDAMHQAILGALRDWAVADAAEATQIRQ